MIELGNGKTIDENENFDLHKESLDSLNVSCDRYYPTLEFTFKNRLGTTRYVKLKYNGKKQLQKVSYWDVNPEYDEKSCYFTATSISLGDFNIYKRHFWS